jgi:ABC-type transporter Mla subunit MlaD
MIDPHDRPSRRDVAIGATAIGALAGVAALLMCFGKLQPVLERRFPVILETTSAQGLRAGSLVTLNGVGVGAVRDVAVDPGWNPPVRVTFELRGDARVPADADVRMSGSLVGGASELAFTALAAGKSSGALLAATDPPMRVRGETAGLQERIDAVVSRASALFDEANDTAHLIGSLSQSVQSDASKLASSLQRASDSLASAMARVDGLVARVGKGEGTAGRMVADPALYENLSDSAVRLREALDQANLLLMQIREKGLQIKVP